MPDNINITKLRVIYADTDAMGIVYHTNYIKWFEVGRNEIMRQMGLLYTDVEKHGFNLPVTEAYCHYLFPAKYDQLINIETTIECISRVIVKFKYSIWDEDKKHLLTEGYTIHACTNKEGKIRRIPQIILDLKNKYNIKGE
ncbi:MAG: Acyl-CoA thioester hydrolase YbgC [Smithella sp. PtaU1.Bin162]|nr:MAG: Acyl-CoA thioester hydrolase YbgC [Smithella sp. PtaU1.Bin162]